MPTSLCCSHLFEDFRPFENTDFLFTIASSSVAAEKNHGKYISRSKTLYFAVLPVYRALQLYWLIAKRLQTINDIYWSDMTLTSPWPRRDLNATFSLSYPYATAHPSTLGFPTVTSWVVDRPTVDYRRIFANSDTVIEVQRLNGNAVAPIISASSRYLYTNDSSNRLKIRQQNYS